MTTSPEHSIQFFQCRSPWKCAVEESGGPPSSLHFGYAASGGPGGRCLAGSVVNRRARRVVDAAGADIRRGPGLAPIPLTYGDRCPDPARWFVQAEPAGGFAACLSQRYWV